MTDFDAISYVAKKALEKKNPPKKHIIVGPTGDSISSVLVPTRV